MEENVLSILQKRSDLLVNRRRQDIQDVIDECADRDKILDQTRRTRIVEREGRSRRRRELRNKRQSDQMKDDVHYEGQSSDDELLQSTRMKFQSEFGNQLLCC